MVSVARCFVRSACLLIGACGDDPESPGAKSENSVIQAMEARHAHDSIQQLTFKDEMDHHFVFIPWRSSHVCVMLQSTHHTTSSTQGHRTSALLKQITTRSGGHIQ